MLNEPEFLPEGSVTTPPGFTAAADQKTLKIETPTPASTPATTLPTGVMFDRETLKRVEAEARTRRAARN